MESDNEVEVFASDDDSKIERKKRKRITSIVKVERELKNLDKLRKKLEKKLVRKLKKKKLPINVGEEPCALFIETHGSEDQDGGALMPVFIICHTEHVDEYREMLRNYESTGEYVDTSIYGEKIKDCMEHVVSNSIYEGKQEGLDIVEYYNIVYYK